MAKARHGTPLPEGPAPVVDDEPTLAVDEWPAPSPTEVETAFVAPGFAEQDTEAPGAPASLVSPVSLRRRRAALLGVLGAVVLLLLLVGGAAWLATDGGDPTAASRSPVSPPSNEPSNPAPPVPVPAAAANMPEDEATTTVAPKTGLVPGAIGLTVSKAARMIRAAGLRLRIELEASSLPAGTVIGQDPSAREKVARRSVVDLRVARPERQAPRIVFAPSLVGSTVAAAKSRLRKLGLRWSVSEVASDETGGTVVDQSPAAGTKQRQGSTVVLQVSSGPALIAIPDVIGLSEQSAARELGSTGFEVAVVYEPTLDPAQDGIVLSHDRQGSTHAEKGSLVTITVARLSS